MKLSPVDANLDGNTFKDQTSPEGLLFHYAEGARPLSTPWQVAVERAKMVRKCSLQNGIILDPACGSGIQLAAYCAMIGKKGLGIELDQKTGEAANCNLRRVADHGFDGCLMSSEIIIGDGTKSIDGLKVALLHLDPARPRNSRTHGIEEMQPSIESIFATWKDSLVSTDKGPAILLDLSPRLQAHQRKEVEQIADNFWPGIAKTWVWTSRGGGRIDRLSLWLGQLAQDNPSRFVRIPPDPKQKPLVIDGESKEIATVRKLPRKGEYVSIIDSGLVESGLSHEFISNVLPNQEVTWSIIEGRRPQFHHDEQMEIIDKSNRLLIQATGRIVKLVHCDLNEETLPMLIDAARECGFGKLTLRTPLSPEQHPILQGAIDRQLSARAGLHSGFVAKQPNDSMLLLCQE